MKKTLFLSAILSVVFAAPSMAALSTSTTTSYSVDDVSVTPTTSTVTIYSGGGDRAQNDLETVPAEAPAYSVISSGRLAIKSGQDGSKLGTIIVASGKDADSNAIAGGQLFLDGWSSDGRLNVLTNDIIIGASSYIEGDQSNAAIRIHEGGTLSGTLTLAANAQIRVTGANATIGKIEGSDKTLTLTSDGQRTLNLTGNATLGTLTAGNVTLSLGNGVQVNLRSGNSSVLSVSGNNGIISVAKGATFTATAQDFGTHKVTGAGNITFTGSTTSSTNHDHIISADTNFTGTLTLAGRYNLKSSDFGNAAKVVLVGDRDTNRTGFWAGNEASSLNRNLEITGEYFVEFYGDKDITLNGTVTGNNLKLTNGGTVTFNEDTSLKKLEVDSRNKANFAAGKTHVVDSISGSGAVQFNSAVNVGNGKTMAFSGSGTTTANNYVSLDANAHVTLGGSAVLVAKDAASDKGVWIGAGADITISDTAKLKVEGLTISAAGTNSAVISRLNNTTAKLGVVINNADSAEFLKNVKVVNADVVYAGSGTLYLGSMQGGSLSSTGNIEFADADSTIGSLTLSGNTITLGTEASHANDLTITTALTVSGTGSAMNANLVMNSGTLTFADGSILTMGCDVTIGDTVTVVLTDAMVQSIMNGNDVAIIAGVDKAYLSQSLTFIGSGDMRDYVAAHESVYSLKQVDDKVYITPEPATATLSLLALAALAARRKRH